MASNVTKAKRMYETYSAEKSSMFSPLSLSNQKKKPYSDQLYVGKAPPTVLEVELLPSFSSFFQSQVYGENWHSPVIHLTGVRPYSCACKCTNLFISVFSAVTMLLCVSVTVDVDNKQCQNKRT